MGGQQSGSALERSLCRGHTECEISSESTSSLRFIAMMNYFEGQEGGIY